MDTPRRPPGDRMDNTMVNYLRDQRNEAVRDQSARAARDQRNISLRDQMNQSVRSQRSQRDLRNIEILARGGRKSKQIEDIKAALGALREDYAKELHTLEQLNDQQSEKLRAQIQEDFLEDERFIKEKLGLWDTERTLHLNKRLVEGVSSEIQGRMDELFADEIDPLDHLTKGIQQTIKNIKAEIQPLVGTQM